MKLSSTLAFTLAGTSLFLAPVLANDTVIVPQNFARSRVVKLEVTPMGLVLNVGTPIRSVNLSHLKDIVFVGLDGALCDAQTDCPQDAQAPTQLLLRKIPPIPFKNQQPSPSGEAMLFVMTNQGLYRFQLKPVNKTPNYTEVEIAPNQSNSTSPKNSAFPGAI